MRTVSDLTLGEHVCCLYDTEAEHRHVVSAFLAQGLRRGGRCVYVVDGHTSDHILQYFDDVDMDPAQHLSRGQLLFLRKEEAYLRMGFFHPEKMIELLQQETARALREGYQGLWVTGEMTWALSGAPGSTRLIEYEAQLNRFFPGSKCVAVCQYDRRRFPPATLLNVLRTHPWAVVNGSLFENFYYVPPHELLSLEFASAELDNWMRHLAELTRCKEALQATASARPQGHNGQGDGDTALLKREINELLQALGRPPKFAL